MSQVEQSTRTLATHGRAEVFGRALFIAVVIVAVASAAIYAISRIAGSPSGSSVALQVDPLRQPALIEFRRGERGMAATQVDPLRLPALIEFRRGERGIGESR